jgi:hypothetical protein
LAFVDDDVLHLVSTSEGADRIVRTMALTKASWYGLSMASAVPLAHPERDRRELTQTDLDALVDGMVGALIAVYRDESHILWLPR